MENPVFPFDLSIIVVRSELRRKYVLKHIGSDQERDVVGAGLDNVGDETAGCRFIGSALE
jgi:hypothetical protein